MEKPSEPYCNASETDGSKIDKYEKRRLKYREKLKVYESKMAKITKIKEDIEEILIGINEKTDFQDSGTLDLPNYKVYYQTPEIKKVLLGDMFNLDIEKFKEISKKSPYGDSIQKKTVTDENFRKSLEIDAKNLILENPNFEPNSLKRFTNIFNISKILENKLAIKDVRVEPYKLLLYQEGSFFECHRDSLPSVTMIGTVVLSLSSDYKGGSLIVNYNDAKKEFNLKKNEWCFFYGDSHHEVTKLTSGNRFVFTFKIYSEYSSIKMGPKVSEIHWDLLKENINKILKIGDNVVIKLFHDYPKSPLIKELKGMDLLLFKCLVKIGFEDSKKGSELPEDIVDNIKDFLPNNIGISQIIDRTNEGASSHDGGYSWSDESLFHVVLMLYSFGKIKYGYREDYDEKDYEDGLDEMVEEGACRGTVIINHSQIKGTFYKYSLGLGNANYNNNLDYYSYGITLLVPSEIKMFKEMGFLDFSIETNDYHRGDS